jgi:flagellar motor switch protein FliG
MADSMNGDTRTAPRSFRAPSGADAAAILLMLLDEADAAAVVRDLDQDEIRRLTKAMYGAADADEHAVEIALDQFVGQSRNVSALAVGADARIRTVMHQALGNVRADNILAELAPQKSAASLAILRWMDIEQITDILASEHPQVSALILSVLVPEVAADAIAPLDERKQADLMMRAAQLDGVAAAAIEDLEAVLTQATTAAPPPPRQALGGPGDVAKIIKQMPKPLSERTIRALRKMDKRLANAIEEEMFVFENLRDLDARTLGNVLRSVDAQTLGMALKGAEEDMVEMCLATMSKRAAESIADEMAEMTRVKRSDVDDAQRSIMLIVRRMVANGEIASTAGGSEYV